MRADSLAELEADISRDLGLIAYPSDSWVPPSPAPGGGLAYDVVIVGAGQGGLAIAAFLKRERVSNILVIDQSPPGEEGIWRRFARMPTLRTAKNLCGIDLGVPSLTFQAWFEAQRGPAAFQSLGKVAKDDWQDYLVWIRRMLAIPVRNNCRFTGVAPAADLLSIEVSQDGRAETIHTRKLVLAMGIETSGRWWMPPDIAALPPQVRALAADAIDFGGLAGRRVVVVGAAASAFDNAATALEAGAATVTLLCRRSELQRVQPYKIIANSGFLHHFGALPDRQRWRMMNHLLSIREAFPRETWERATRHDNFSLITGAGVTAAQLQGGDVVLSTGKGEIRADFVIAGTGFEIDLAARPELAGVASHIATWGDRYAPPAGLENQRLAKYPYLNDAMAFTERRPGEAPWLRHIHCFNFGATMSFGPSGSSISALKYAAPRIVDGITRDLFLADARYHENVLMNYAVPEFELTSADK